MRHFRRGSEACAGRSETGCDVQRRQLLGEGRVMALRQDCAGDRMRRALACAVAVSLSCAFQTVSAQSGTQYRFFVAGSVPGSTYTVPLATSRTQIVGDYQLPAAGHTRLCTNGGIFLNGGAVRQRVFIPVGGKPQRRGRRWVLHHERGL